VREIYYCIKVNISLLTKFVVYLAKVTEM
jgi:hypothetical protein